MKRILENLLYYCGFVSVFYFLNRNRKRILTFHNVLPDGVCKNNVANFVSNTESDFRMIIREVSKKFMFTTDLGDVHRATITFDDGFVNQYETARRILQEEGNIPAIIFAAGDNIDNGDPLRATVVDLLAIWISYVPEGNYSVWGERVEIVNGFRGKVWHRIVRPKFAADVRTKGRDTLRELDGAYPLSEILKSLPTEYVRLRLCGITTAQIVELRKLGWLVGHHTKTHFQLSSLPYEEQLEEMLPTDSEMLRTVFSYPYGTLEAVNEDSLRAVKGVGYPCAVSNMPSETMHTGRFFLPRMDLPSDRIRLHIRLSGLEHFIRTGKLLPKCMLPKEVRSA